MLGIQKSILLFMVIAIGKTMIAQNDRLASGRIERYEQFQSENVPARTIDVWLPDNYDTAKKYAVLYMQDGQMLFDSTNSWNKQEWGVDEVMGSLLNNHAIEDCIVVGIWNIALRRHTEYFPEKAFEKLSFNAKQEIWNWKDAAGNSYFINGKPESDNYLKFIVNELKPFIDRNYSVYTERAHTFIMGSSMGGLISMYAICEYPQIFGGAACLSTHWTGLYYSENNPIPGAFLQYLSSTIPSPDNHRLYFDHGIETLDSLYAPFQKNVDKLLRKNGYNKKNYLSKIFPGTSHTENAWHARLDIPLLFLLKK